MRRSDPCRWPLPGASDAQRSVSDARRPLAQWYRARSVPTRTGDPRGDRDAPVRYGANARGARDADRAANLAAIEVALALHDAKRIDNPSGPVDPMCVTRVPGPKLASKAVPCVLTIALGTCGWNRRRRWRPLRRRPSLSGRSQAIRRRRPRGALGRQRMEGELLENERGAFSRVVSATSTTLSGDLGLGSDRRH